MSHILSHTVQQRLLQPLTPWQRFGRSRAASAVNNTPTLVGRDRGHKVYVAPAFLIQRDGHRAPRLIWTDGKSWVLSLLCALALTSGACNTQNPNAPTSVAEALKKRPVAAPEALYAVKVTTCANTAHDLPVSFEGQETGPIYYVCATQPREYMDANGENRTMEVDHYLSTTHCPAVPID